MVTKLIKIDNIEPTPYKVNKASYLNGVLLKHNITFVFIGKKVGKL